MESKRFFVNNLPPGTVDADLQNLFQDYGEIEKIEVKTKENLVDPQNPKFLAFVTLSIKEKLVEKCVNELSNYKVKGQYISVSVAKESFLERLKRERANDGKKSEETKPKFTDAPVNIAVPKSFFDAAPSQNTTIKFDIDQEIGDLDDDDQVVYQSISKKRASHSLQNGKIKIASVSSEPIHVITSKPKVKEQNEKAQKADQKRKESLNKMKNQYNQQKNAIQQALSIVDGQKSKKIVFDDDGEVDSGFEGGVTPNPKKQKLELFDEEEEENEEDFNGALDIKEQFHGKKGAKLMKLQSKMGLDSRFKMNSNFLEDEEEEQVEEQDSTEFDERKWQMNFIEQSLGKKVDHSANLPDGKKKQKRSMQRYDPSMEEKFLKQKAPADEGTDHSQKTTEQVPEVSKEIFYSVTDDLSKSLKRRGDGFSLLSMFGNQEPENDDKEEYKEKILVKKGDKPLAGGIAFDSSDSEDEIAQITKDTKPDEKKKGGKTKGGVWTENFFFVDGDIRFKEGVNFFKSTAKTVDAPEDYDKVKNNLRQIINKKISKTKKILNKNKGLHKNHKPKSKKK